MALNTIKQTNKLKKKNKKKKKKKKKKTATKIYQVELITYIRNTNYRPMQSIKNLPTCYIYTS